MSFLRVFSQTPNSSSSSNDSRRQVLTRLKFIGNISPHEKIDSRSLKIESNSIFTPLKRLLFTGDSRETTLYFFSSTIDRSFEIIAAHLHSKHVSEQIFCANILQDLLRSVNGLRAAQKTYSDDKLIVCELDVLIETISAKLFEIQQNHPQLFTIKDLCVFQFNKEKNKDDLEDTEEIKSIKQIKIPPPKSLQINDDNEEEEL